MSAYRQGYIAVVAMAVWFTGCGDSSPTETEQSVVEGEETNGVEESDAENEPLDGEDGFVNAPGDGSASDTEQAESDSTGSDVDPADSFADGGTGEPAEPADTLVERIPLGTKGAIFGVFTVSETLTYAVGQGGSLLRFNGIAWSPMDSGTIENLRGVWSNGPDFAVAVGDQGTLRMFDGESWVSGESKATVDLYAVFGFGSDDVYAVGDEGTILHWNGEVWIQQISNITTDLRCVFGPTPGAVFAGGEQARVLRRTNGVWVSSNSAASSVTIQGVWGTSSTNMIAVGSGGTLSRWDGTGWTAMVSNDIQERDLHGIWGASADNIVAVGDKGTVLRYEDDSDDWEVVVVKGPLNKGVNLRAVSGYLDASAGLSDSKQTKAFAFGDDGKMLQLEDGNWSDAKAELEADLRDIWVTDDVAVAVGDGGTIVRRKTAGWAGENSGTLEDLHGVAGNGEELVAVGTGGAVVQRVNGQWSELLAPTTEDLFGVVSDGEDWIVVGGKGTILRYSDGEWVEEVSGTSAQLKDIWCAEDGSLYAVGTKGTVVYSPGDGAWGTLPVSSSSDLESVYGHQGEIWVVGNWVILRGNLTGLEVAQTLSSDYLYGIWVAGDESVLAVGWAGLLLSGGNEGFEEIPTSSTVVLESVMGVSAQDYFAVGRSGTLLRYRETE